MFDFWAYFCQSALMETHASVFRRRANRPGGQERFPMTPRRAKSGNFLSWITIVGPASDPGPAAVTHSTPSHFRNIPRSQPGRANKSSGSTLTDGRDEDPPGFSQGGRS